MDCDFIEIGTSNFDTEIGSCPDSSVGISVEPLENYLEDLPNKPNVIKYPAAISSKPGELDLYYVPPDVVDKYFNEDGLKGCNSLGAPHPTAQRIMKERGLESMIKTKKVPVITFGDLLEKFNVKSIKYLKIDTEGHDCIILQSMLDHYKANRIQKDSPLWPNQIKFESNIQGPN